MSQAGLVSEQVVVLDYGGQYTHLIARRIRRLGVYSHICAPEDYEPGDPTVIGVILSGGPGSVRAPGAPTLPCPVDALPTTLGLCYGHQLLAHASGGTVGSGGAREYGLATVDARPDATLFAALPAAQQVWMSHGDHVEELPAGFRVTASTPTLPVAAFESDDRRLFGLQFHPEVTHTEHGTAILDRFLTACGARRTWDPASFRDAAVRRVLGAAGAHKDLFLLVSGGVDSLVTLAVCLEAVGPERVRSLHVDTGYMRHRESAEVMAALEDMGFRNLELIDASERFHSELDRLVEPEAKRRVIGRLFVEVVQDALGTGGLGDDTLLVQGTIYPDRIESGGSKNAAVIKTHHNRVAEIQRLLDEGKVVEPLADLYKDEVRELGEELGLPRDLVQRHPFPGPGLAIRILASDTDVPEDVSAEASDAAALAAPEGLRATILPVRSVGVQGDARTYAHPVALWGPAAPDWGALHRAGTRLANRLRTVNRAVWSPVDPGRFRLARTGMDRATVARLQAVDHLIGQRTAHLHDIWQLPVVALPLVDATGGQVFVMRPVRSRDAMTADFFRMEPALLASLTAEVAALPGVGALLYDVTTKPPSTIEWE